jgi:hypothetical protein
MVFGYNLFFRFIIAEIPELIYTGNENDYVYIERLKIYIDANSKRYKILNKNIKNYIKQIKERLNIKYLENNYKDPIFRCKLIILAVNPNV